MVKKGKTILEYCSNCDEEVGMPIVQRDPSNPHLVWVRCPKCNETKPVDIVQVTDELHEGTEPGLAEDGEVEIAEPGAEESEEEVEEVIPEIEPVKKPAKKKPAKKKSAKDKKEAEPEVVFKIAPNKARDYHPWEEYKPGETIKHPQWKEYGVILRVRRSGGGRSLAEVRFEKMGEKKLLIGQKPPTA